MSKKKQVEIIVVDSKYEEMPPEDVIEFLAWFQGKLESIPEAHRASAAIEIDAYSGYENDPYARVKIAYTRPETDEEMKAREAGEFRLENIRMARELQTLAELKEKYEKK